MQKDIITSMYEDKIRRLSEYINAIQEDVDASRARIPVLEEDIRKMKAAKSEIEGLLLARKIDGQSHSTEAGA